MKYKHIIAIILAGLTAAGLVGCAARETPTAAAFTVSSLDAATPTPEPTATLTPTPAPTPTEEPTPEPEKLPLEGVVIGIDPGHQGKQNSETEPQGPGSDVMKMKVTSGTEGVATGTPEHKVNLAVGLKLRDLLEGAGATVVMTRESADVDISNKQRAQMFNDHEVNLAIRLHCDGADDSGIVGAFMLIPEDNPYQSRCREAAGIILENYCEDTGIANKGVTVRSDQTGFNWCERPIVNIEMGRMSNPDEDRKLSDADFQMDMAWGLFNGIKAYFAQKE